MGVVCSPLTLGDDDANSSDTTALFKQELKVFATLKTCKTDLIRDNSEIKMFVYTTGILVP